MKFAIKLVLVTVVITISAGMLQSCSSGEDSGLKEHWNLNDGGTGTSVASANGATEGKQKWGVWLPNNTFGMSLDFSTKGSYVFAQNSKADLNKDFSIAAWVLAPPREKYDRVILMQGSKESPEEGSRLFLDGKNNFELTFESTGVTGLESSGVSLIDGLWHHVMVTRSRNDFKYYVDGKMVKSLKVSGNGTAKSGDIYIGSDSQEENGFDGTIAEVKIYNTAKKPSDVTKKIIDQKDNTPQVPRMNLKKGIVIDRRQYYAPEPLPHEGQTVREQDIINIINTGADHVKLLLTPNHLIDEDGSLIVENMAYIEQVLLYVEKNNFRAILCLHPEQDFKPKYLGNLDNFEILVKWYAEFADYLGKYWKPDTVAIQLMTEPFSNNNTVSWSWMSDRMWGAVRNVLPEHTILTSSDQAGNIEKLKLMSPASDNNLIYTFTTYEPYTIGWYYYSHNPAVKTFWGYVKDIPYPVLPGVDYTEEIEKAIELVPEIDKPAARSALKAYVEGKNDGNNLNFKNMYDCLYNARWHDLRAKSLDEWRQKYGGNIHIMCVEFGCMDRLTPINLWKTAVEGSGIPDEDRIQFVKDMRSAFDAYDIGWSYWSYNEAHTLFLPEFHVYGTSPSVEEAKNIFDYDMLIEGLGLTPLVSKD